MKQEQFKNMVVPLRPKLLHYAKRIVENDDEAEDVVQEVFLKLWFMRDELDNYNSIPALSMTMTKNLSINILRFRQKTRADLLEATLIYDSPSPHHKLEEKDEVDKLMKIIDTLPNLQQSILRMKHIDGLETEEIAQLTGSTHEAIRVNLSRARKRVRELFLKQTDI
jgi:RNA polymerase sigma factor, sigma-70 family